MTGDVVLCLEATNLSGLHERVEDGVEDEAQVQSNEEASVNYPGQQQVPNVLGAVIKS